MRIIKNGVGKIDEETIQNKKKQFISETSSLGLLAVMITF